MTRPAWHFRKKRAGDVARDPISSEFFSSESVEDAARSVIREAIQNSLDARPRPFTMPADIRIRIGVGSSALHQSTAAAFHANAWPHLSASGTGLGDPPQQRERCSFLTVEDFGTQGLEGNPRDWTTGKGANAFYAFFRSEAYSDKAGDERGRWGVGKLVFPRASRASMFFGYTVQKSTTTPLLMGRMILRHHQVGGVTYQPDAMFGICETVHDDPEFVVPTSDVAAIRDFREAFGLERRGEPGLSVVVPWLADEGDFTPRALIQSVAEEYLLPILRGHLVVTVSSGSEKLKLDRPGLLRQAASIGGQSLARLVRLGDFASTIAPKDVTQVKPADQTNAARFPDEALTTEQAATARKRLEEGHPVAFSLPIRVAKKGAGSEQASLRIHLMASDSSESVVPVFVRDEITISGVRSPRLPGTLALVTCDDDALATLLGDAENPAHTDWRPNTRGFKDKYLYAKAYLTFVKESPQHLYSAIHGGAREDDHFALGAFFPDLEAEMEDSRRGGTRKKGPPGDDTPRPPQLPRKSRQYSLRQIDGGFEVSRGAPDTEVPSQLKIAAAYDVRRGQPLAKYERFDFDFARRDLEIECEHAKIVSADGNAVVVSVSDPGFRVRVHGFDTHRDVFVRVTVPELADGE